MTRTLPDYEQEKFDKPSSARIAWNKLRREAVAWRNYHRRKQLYLAGRSGEPLKPKVQVPLSSTRTPH